MGWRSFPSAVHSLNFTSTTTFGFTQCGFSFVFGRVLNGVPGKELKGMADEYKKKLGSGVVALIGVEDGKASAVVGVTDDLAQGKGAKSLSAVELVKAGVAALGGKGGGGRPDMAQGGGPDAAKAPEALKAIEAALADAK